MFEIEGLLITVTKPKRIFLQKIFLSKLQQKYSR